jgi:hypothetical protein
VFLYHQPTQEKIDESFSGLPALFGVTIIGVLSGDLIRPLIGTPACFPSAAVAQDEAFD